MKQFLTVILTSCLILIGTSAMTVKAAEQVYGWQLMTQQERNEYRAKMQTLKTAEERERYRNFILRPPFIKALGISASLSSCIFL